MSFWKVILASAIGQILTTLLVQGFLQSYWGRNGREELTRIWDSFSKHMRKQKCIK
jgi:hypothetical protein